MKARKAITIAALMLTAGIAREECIQIVWASESAGISVREQPAHKIVQPDPIFPRPPQQDPRLTLPWPTPPRPNEEMRPGDPGTHSPQTDAISDGPQKLLGDEAIVISAEHLQQGARSSSSQRFGPR